MYRTGDTVGSVSAAGSRGHFVLLDKDESCPTADLSNIGCPNGPACLTGELLKTPLMCCLSVIFYFLLPQFSLNFDETWCE